MKCSHLNISLRETIDCGRFEYEIYECEECGLEIPVLEPKQIRERIEQHE